MSVQIIRIEHLDNGLGIFRASNKEGVDYCDLIKNNSFLVRHNENFPNPLKDVLIKRLPFRCEFCAFKTIEQLQSLFLKEELEEMITIGFNILLLEVSKCKIGEHQVLYEKKNIIKTEIINNLFI